MILAADEECCSTIKRCTNIKWYASSFEGNHHPVNATPLRLISRVVNGKSVDKRRAQEARGQGLQEFRAKAD